MIDNIQRMYSQLGSMAGGAAAMQSPSDEENPCVLKAFKCIECGRVKQEGNHWFVFSSVHTFQFYSFDPKDALNRAERLACSESCLLTQATKFIHREEKK